MATEVEPDIVERFQGVERRVGEVERRIDKGFLVRKEMFEVIVNGLQRDLTAMRVEMVQRYSTEDKRRDDERTSREAERRSLRNLLILALLGATLSLAVSLIVASVT